MEPGIGSLLRHWRTARGLSVRQLARQAGVGRSTVSYWEAGARRPSVAELEAVLAALGASPCQRAEALERMDAPRAVRRLRETDSDRPPVGGDLLRAMRLRRGWTQAVLASHLGVRQRAISQWERSEEWPRAEQLHALCHALGAHEDELIALTCGRFSLAPTAGDDASAELVPGHWQEILDHPLKDLRFLTHEAKLWRLAQHLAAAQGELALTYAIHATWLAHAYRLEEASHCARRALARLKPPFPKDPLWLWAVHIAAKHAAERGPRPAPMKGATILREWLPAAAAWPHYQCWFFHNIAEYVCHSGAVAEALDLSAEARRVSLRTEGVASRHPNLSHAQVLLRAGRAAEALDLLPLPDETVIPLQQVNEALTWAEALAQVGDRAGAHHWLDFASETLTKNALDRMQPRLDALARRV